MPVCELMPKNRRLSAANDIDAGIVPVNPLRFNSIFDTPSTVERES
jgi:hypothetical protein